MAASIITAVAAVVAAAVVAVAEDTAAGTAEDTVSGDRTSTSIGVPSVGQTLKVIDLPPYYLPTSYISHYSKHPIDLVRTVWLDSTCGTSEIVTIVLQLALNAALIFLNLV